MGMVQATQSYIVMIDGVEEMIHAGDILDDSHPVVTSQPADRFRPVEVRTFVEEATAKPGARRKAAVPKK